MAVATDLLGRSVEVLGFWPWVLRRFLSQRDVVLTLVAGLLVSTALARPVARRFGVQPLTVFAAATAAAAIVAVTVVPDGGYRAYGSVELPAAGWATWWRHGWSASAWALTGGIDGPFNVMLFVPAASLWALVTGRPAAVWAALVALSASIETFQSFAGLREASVGDVLANGVGAGLGVVGCLLAMAVLRPGGPPPPRGLTG